MDLEARLDALYRAPLGQFIQVRNELASDLKKAGRAEDAAQVKSRPKPAVSAWAVNQLAFWQPDSLAALRLAGEALRDAIAKGAPLPEVQKAQDGRRRAVQALVRSAEEILGDAGHATNAATMQRVTATLEALSVAGPDGPRPGRLAEDLEPPGFEALAGMSLAPSLPAKPPEAPRAPAPDAPAPAPAPRADPPDQIARARAALASAREELAAATKEADDAADRLADARHEVAELETRLSAARVALAAQEVRAQSLASRKARAEGEVARAQRQLDATRGG